MWKKITKADLVDSIYKDSPYERQTVQDVVDKFLAELKNSISDGNVIELRRFGTFEPKLRNGRKEARNPKNGDPCSVPPHYIAYFRAGQDLKKEMAEIPVENKENEN